MADSGTFRSKLFGGFDRNDVANYIEKLAAERNDYIVECRDLEVKVQDLSDEIERLKAEFTEQLSSQEKAHEEQIEELTADYENKLAEAEKAVREAEQRAEEKRTAELDAAKAVLDELLGSFGDAESDTRLLLDRIGADLAEAGKKLEKMPDVLTSSKDRLTEIRQKLDGDII